MPTPSRGLVYLILGGDVYLPLILIKETIFLMGKQSLKITSWIVQFIPIVHSPITTQCTHSKECHIESYIYKSLVLKDCDVTTCEVF